MTAGHGLSVRARCYLACAAVLGALAAGVLAWRLKRPAAPAAAPAASAAASGPHACEGAHPQRKKTYWDFGSDRAGAESAALEKCRRKNSGAPEGCFIRRCYAQPD